MNRSAHLTEAHGPNLLTAIARAFGTHGAERSWQDLAARVRLIQEPDVAVAVLASLGRCVPGLGGFPRLSADLRLFLMTASNVVGSLVQAGWPEEELDAMRLRGSIAQSVAANPFLAALVVMPYTDLEQRIGCLQLLLVVGILTEHPDQEAFIAVADATRKAKRYLGWRQLIADMPQPDAEPWPAAFAQWASKSVREPAAYRHFRRAVARAVHAVGAAVSLAAVPQSAEPVGRLIPLLPESVLDAADAWSATTQDADRRPRPVARLVFDDDDNPAGPEPSQLELALEAAVVSRQVSLPAHASRTGARLAAFKLMEDADRLRWCWDHLHCHEIRVLIAQATRDITHGSARLCPAALAVLVLATGLPVTEVPTLAFAPTEGAYGITPDGQWRKPCYVHARVVDATHGHYRLHTGGLDLRLPTLVQRAIALCAEAAQGPTTLQDLLRVGASDAVAVLSSWVEPVRAEYRAGRFTHGRLQRALGVEVAAIVRDDAVVHCIAGTQADVPPMAMHYGSFDISDLARVYANAVSRIFGDYA